MSEEFATSNLSAEELRTITRKYTERIGELLSEYFEDTNFQIEEIEIQRMYHLTAKGITPAEVILKIAPARRYYAK